MADERFDLSYRGLIAPGADPEQARRRLAALFKLSDAGADRLFTGKPVIVKRDVDAATAAQFRKVFAHAGAVLTVVAAGVAESAEQSPPQTPEGTPLTLAPLSGPLEQPPEAPFPALDLSYLSLIPGDDWTLEDCAPPPTPIQQLDLSHLTLEPPPPADRDTDPRPD